MAFQKIVLHDPEPGDFFYREELKTLRANIQFSGRKNKVIMFTSVFQGEGKSDTTFHVAQEMSRMGRKVLLIDADIRGSRFAARYGVKGKTEGLSEYLSGQVANVNDFIYATNYENLYVILAGSYSANSAELLGDELFRNFLNAASKVYDYVFIDTPPLGAVIDAAMIGQFCDAAILVIESGAVSYRAAQKVVQQLEMTDTKILGVVLNRVDRKENGKYGKYGKYGRYGKYGKYGKYGYGYGYGKDRRDEVSDEEKRV